MTIQELMRGIELPEKAQRIVLDYEMEEDEYLSWKEMFKDNFSLFLEKWKEKEDSKQWILSFYVKMSGELYEKYLNTYIMIRLEILQYGVRNVIANMEYMG